MKYALFLGCTIPVRGQNYEMAARQVAEHVGIELVDIEGFCCCGFPVKSMDKKASLLMAARNLALAEKEGLEMASLCNACTAVLSESIHELNHHDALREEVNAELERIDGIRYEGTTRIRHFARILFEDIGPDKLKEYVTNPLDHLKLAVHYGCHYSRPKEVYAGFDDPEAPTTLQKMIEITGATFVPYSNQGQCCGGAVLAVDQDLALTMSHDKLTRVREAGAQALISICPFCSVMYEANQNQIEKKFEIVHNLPILYFPQVLGAAMGIDLKKLGCKMNRPKVIDLLEQKAA